MKVNDLRNWPTGDGGPFCLKELIMAESPHDLARRLADQAERVCRHYLSSGRREGRYWLVGDVRNTPGRSMYVRLKDSPKGLELQSFEMEHPDAAAMTGALRSFGIEAQIRQADEARLRATLKAPRGKIELS